MRTSPYRFLNCKIDLWTRVFPRTVSSFAVVGLCGLIAQRTFWRQGTHSVGVAPQYASALAKTANCQTLVSLTLAHGEVPVMLALRLFLPESWTDNPARLKRAGVPAEYRTARTKPEIALTEIDRVIAAGVRSVACWRMPAVG
jgi:SRSO17 transposase